MKDRMGKLVRACLLPIALGCAAPATLAAPVSVEWVTVGSPGNLPDTEVMLSDRTTAYGSVPYSYRISKFLVTNAQYAAFLNAKAKLDLHVLYIPLMDRKHGYGIGSGIIRKGLPGNYSYTVEPGRENYPVNYINLYDAMRFVNWMNNGQGNADTESGAYTLLGHAAVPTNAFNIRRSPGAKIYLPNDDEWYKAAYYDPVQLRYYDFPGGTDAFMECAMPGPTPNTANCGLVTAANNPANPGLTGVASWFWSCITPVGAYTNSASPYGAFDMGGNLFQWTEDLTYAVINQYHAGGRIAPLSDQVHAIFGNPYEVTGIGPCAILRGTDFGDGPEFNHANGRTCDFAFYKWETYGIRIASRP
jgi:formylglycine-generating enzyme required for sulfatase activity